MSTVQQLLNVLKKTFYDLTPVNNKQMSLMPMANGGIGFVNTKPKTCGQLLSPIDKTRTGSEKSRIAINFRQNSLVTSYDQVVP